ncbi:MAG TPA: hypothetical protein VNN25_28545, partial [Thermoanaerobaculia bacterium]|nr:hypothetical protein [Thermoanaerobaculia bacterium]
MNRTSRFFRQVWRVNALLILVAAAAAAFAVCAFVWSQLEGSLRRQSAETVAPIIPGKPATHELHLGGLVAIDGTSLYRATLSTPADRSGSSFSSGGYSSDTRNILVVDGASATSHWLLPTDKELIVFNQDVGNPESKEGHAQPPLATVVLVKTLSP